VTKFTEFHLVQSFFNLFKYHLTKLKYDTIYLFPTSGSRLLSGTSENRLFLGGRSVLLRIESSAVFPNLPLTRGASYCGGIATSGCCCCCCCCCCCITGGVNCSSFFLGSFIVIFEGLDTRSCSWFGSFGRVRDN